MVIHVPLGFEPADASKHQMRRLILNSMVANYDTHDLLGSPKPGPIGTFIGSNHYRQLVRTSHKIKPSDLTSYYVASRLKANGIGPWGCMLPDTY